MSILVKNPNNGHYYIMLHTNKHINTYSKVFITVCLASVAAAAITFRKLKMKKKFI